MKKKWNVNVNGTDHAVTYRAGFGTKLTVDDKTYKLKSSNWFIQVLDYPIQLEGCEIRLVAIANKIDLVVDGVYQSNGAPYTPIDTIPKWIAVLAGISVLLGLILNGALGAALGIFLGTIYYRIALKGKPSYSIIAFTIGIILQLGFAFATTILALSFR